MLCNECMYKDSDSCVPCENRYGMCLNFKKG